jgi:hypothetical protein
MELAGRIIGGFLLVVWMWFIFVGRRYVCKRGLVMYSTVFQFNILPFIAGAGLVLSGNLVIIPVIPVVWVLSIFFPQFFLYIFPLVAGGVLGSMVVSQLDLSSSLWGFGGPVLGAAVMFVFCTFIVEVITTDRWFVFKRAASTFVASTPSTDRWFVYRLARDREFISETGLDGVGVLKRMAGLSWRVGFVKAMYTTYRTIESRMPDADLDNRLTTLVWSRVRLIPEITKLYDPEAYARTCFAEAKMGSPLDWDMASHYDKFFEVSLRTAWEEEKLDLNPVSYMIGEEMIKQILRETYKRLFLKVFEHNGWELK